MSDTTIPVRPAAPVRVQEDRNSLRDVIDRMDRAREHIAKADPHLSDTIRLLADRADKPGLIDQQNYRTRVAYSLMDLEKLAGPVTNMPGPLRDEMQRLGTRITGLQNERLAELMRMTASISDSGLVRDIRITAIETAERPSQNSAIVQDRVQALESRARLASRISAAALPTAGADAGRPSGGPATEAKREVPESGPIGRRLASEMPNETVPPVRPSLPFNGAANPAIASVAAPGLVASIINAVQQHSHQRAAQAALDPTPTPLADRAARYEQRVQAAREESVFRGAEQSGRAAVDAMQGFANGPGAAVMGRIRDAAKADPGGMAGVMSEMRPGGVYADLRSQFDGALQKEKGFVAAYDRAAAAAGQYGKDRIAVDAIAAQRPDIDALTSRFQKLDAQIGTAAAQIPGRREGASALEDLATKAAELLSRAVEKIRSAISPASRAGSGPSPTP